MKLFGAIMHDLSFYQIQIKGQMDEETFNAASPLQIKITDSNVSITHFEVYTDQSGLIGLLRHLHRQGFVLLALKHET